ncbi:MAG TPA: hypothetical protein VGB70_15130 [Allosphingosinicella sp.]|jgi:hypothetical protein
MSLLVFLFLTAADPTPPPADPKPAMAIDEVGMPVDKKDKKGKGVLTGPGATCDASSAGRFAISEQGMPADKKRSVKHGKSTPKLFRATGRSCSDAASRMAIDEVGKGKTVLTGGGRDCDDANGACRASACAVGARIAITETGQVMEPKKGKPSAILASSSSGAASAECPSSEDRGAQAGKKKGKSGKKSK